MSVKGSCHCGSTQFEVEAAPGEVTQCTCSLCAKRGALWAYYQPVEVNLAPATTTATYRWRSLTVAHNFCPYCGCTTYTQSPDWSTGEPDYDHPRIAINARLLDDFDLGAVPIKAIDGKNLW